MIVVATMMCVSGRSRVDGSGCACQSRRVKSCGPSGSQDLAFLKEIDLLPLREETSRNGWQPTADALLTMRSNPQAVAIHGNGFRLFEPFSGHDHLPSVATGCDR